MYFILMCSFYTEGLTVDDEYLEVTDYYENEQEEEYDDISLCIDETLLKVTDTIDDMLEQLEETKETIENDLETMQ